jgi:hypothetical protein
MAQHTLLLPLLLLIRPPPCAADPTPPTHQSRGLITVENEKAREVDIDPDEYLWETLPGRCCFMQGADDCDLCSVWSDPQTFCHTSRESCELCGMSLYCPAPPPLLNADKVCTGPSRVGEGCNDDLDTGLCQTSGALANCERECRRTQHCEMIVLYTDSMAGTCVLCRNMLNFEHTEQASTRVYAVEHLDLLPPTPPGFQREETKHFSILQDPSPPPPPHPPPSPPHAPPPPLPAALGTRTDTHIECEFFEGMDYSILSGKGNGQSPGLAAGDGAASTVDTTADTKRHCCSKCGMHAGCTDFVFEPASKVCVLMPAIPSYLLHRSPNNSTIAGSVTISRIDQSHAKCHFHVGSGYAGGAIGVGHALPGRTMKSKQDCCDSCERDERCAKFVFEHYSGDCQLFGPEAEHYFTFNLLSGTVDSRAAPIVDPNQREGDGEDGDGEDGGGDGGGGSPYTYEPVTDGQAEAPPAPAFYIFEDLPPPSPPGTEGDVAQIVLEDFSISMFVLITVGFVICFCLFFGQDLQSLLHKYTGGRFGKAQKSLLPTRDSKWVAGQKGQELEGNLGTKAANRKKGKALPAGWVKVTVQTALVNQKKDLEVGGCRTVAELNEILWDEFGHLLKGMRVKDAVLLVWASEEGDKDGTARWMHVTDASDMSKVVACDAIKLRSKKDIDVKGLTVAFAPESAQKGKGKNKNGKGAEAAPEPEKGHSSAPADEEAGVAPADGDDDDEKEEEQDDEDEQHGSSESEEEADGGEVARKRNGGLFQKNGGFEPLLPASPDESDDEETLPARRSSSSSKPASSPAKAAPAKAKKAAANGSSKNGTSSSSKRPSKERDDEEEEATPQHKGKKKNGAVRSRAVASDDEKEAVAAAPKPAKALPAATAALPLLGKRVQVFGLVSKALLNGRVGTATSYDDAKGRYRVRLDAGFEEESKLLAFKAENLRMA